MNFLAQEEDAAIPVHGYQDYSAAALERIHGVDQFLPIVAAIYVFALTVIYAMLHVTKNNENSKSFYKSTT